MSPEGKRLLNIVILGFGFMFMFTAFQTCGNIEVGLIHICTPDSHLHAAHPPDLNFRYAEQTPFFILQQTVIKSFNSTAFHGSGYTR